MNLKKFFCDKLFLEYPDLDKEEIKEEISECVDKKNYFIFGNLDGFITWFEVIKEKKLYIYINNGFLGSKVNLFVLRKFFRKRYPKAVFFYWHSRKKDKFVYVK